MKQIIFILIGFFVFQTIHPQNTRCDKWNTDLDFLVKELSEKHYNFFTTRSKNDLIFGVNSIKSVCNNLNDFQVVTKTQQLIAEFGDSHTSLDINQFISNKLKLPVHLYWFSDGLYILHTTNNNKELLGCKLVSINNIPIAEITDSLSTLYTVDNQAIIKNKIPQIISNIQLLEYFGFIKTKKDIEIKIKDSNNQLQSYTLQPAELRKNNRVIFKPESLSSTIKYENVFFTGLFDSNQKIYHILYNKCKSKELEMEYGDKVKAEKMPSFKEFEEKIFHTLNNNPVDKIVFDLRNNNGGNSSQGRELIDKLANYLKEKPSTKIYVVIGRKTFSSAILNAMYLKQLTNATFIGEETSGKPNHFGDIKYFQLPNSKLYINYSTKYFKTTNENMNTITPDIIVETSFSDFTKGIDPVYEYIKTQ